jgi:hypothetical protein
MNLNFSQSQRCEAKSDQGMTGMSGETLILILLRNPVGEHADASEEIYVVKARHADEL